jgi:pimeloyl-ACP methyl ester carboxylesterase
MSRAENPARKWQTTSVLHCHHERLKTEASDVQGQPCGHLIQEEAQEQLLAALQAFLVTA